MCEYLRETHTVTAGCLSKKVITHTLFWCGHPEHRKFARNNVVKLKNGKKLLCAGKFLSPECLSSVDG